VANTATINVHAGGVRSGATTVAALPNGAVFQAVANSGSPSGGPFTCTVTNGTCTISVPAGTSSGTRYAWNVSELTAPSGYYLNPTLDYGTSSVVQPDSYVFRTGTLSNGDSVDVPGSSANGTYSDVRHSGDNNFSGLLATSLNNPPVQQQCGLNIALVLDQSGSMADNNKEANLKTAAGQVVSSLAGTPSNLAIYTFGTRSNNNGHVNSLSTAVPGNVTTLNNFVNGLSITNNQYTNWDEGMYQVPQGQFDLVLFLTDGAPTAYSTGLGSGSDSYYQYVEQGIYSANAIKASGSRIVGIGVGLTSNNNNAEANLRSMTGPVAGNVNSPSTADDYYLASSSGFGNVLAQLAAGNCQNKLNIQKQIENPAGQVITPAPADANGWNFTNSISGAGTIQSPVSTAASNGQNGFATASVSIPAGTTPTVTVKETVTSGYTFVGAQCTVDGQNVTTTVNQANATASFTGKADSVLSCVFTNKQPQPLGTFSVVKQVTGNAASLVPSNTPFTVNYSYPAGSGFAAGSGTLTVKNDGVAVTSGQVPSGAVVTLAEQAPSAVSGATWGTPTFNPASPITIGTNTNVAVTLTNPIALNTGTFSVTKKVTGNASSLVPSSTSFSVNYSYPAGSGYAAGSGTLTVKNDGVAVNGPQIPVGAQVTLVESAPTPIAGTNWGTPTFSPTSPITIGAKGSTLAVTLTNPISLSTGSFSVTKQVSGDASSLVPSSASFTVNYSYPAGSGFAAGSGTLTVKNDGVAVSSGQLPVGAKVTLTESDPAAIAGATWGTPIFSPVMPITIGAGTNVAITLTNPISLNTGSFSVAKKVTGTGAGLVPSTTSFTVNYSYPAGSGYAAGNGTLTVKNDGVAVSGPQIPVGASVTLNEVAPAAIAGTTWGTPSFDPASPITIGAKGTSVAVTLTNPISLNTGTFSVTKSVTGNASSLVGSSASFVVDYSYPAGNGYAAGSGKLTVKNDGQAVNGPQVPVGAQVTLSEEPPTTIPNATWGTPSFSPASPITIGAKGSTVAVTLTNPISLKTGAFTVTKIVSGTGANLVGSGASFTVKYSYPAGSGFAAGSGSLTVKNDGVAVSSGQLPVGAVVTFSEDAPASVPNATWGTPSFSPSSVTVGADQRVAVTLTNPITRDTGSFSVSKMVTGSGSGLVGGNTTFTVDYSYPAGTGYPAGNGTLSVKNDATTTVDGIPTGAVVSLSEESPAAVPDATWGTPTFTPTSPITIGSKGTTVAVTLINPITLNTGSFTVTKQVTGDAASLVPSTASFTVDYSYPAGSAYPADSGKLTVKNDGQSVSGPAIPVGASVTLSEETPDSVTNATWGTPVFSPASPITIAGSGTSVAVTLTNPITLNTGTFSVVKKVTGSGAGLVPSSTAFTVNYSYPAGTGYAAGSGSLVVKNDGAAIVGPQIPVGAKVTLVEAAPSPIFGGTWGTSSFSPTSPITIGAKGTTLAVTLTNPITIVQPTLQLKKVVDGATTPNTEWILTGTGTGSATVTNAAGGDTAVTTVTNGVDYSLSEKAKDFPGAGEFTPGPWSCTANSGGVSVQQTGAGTATLSGLLPGQNVVCTLVNSHVDQGVTITKKVTSSTQNQDGSWTTTYAVSVANKSGVVSAGYNLTDTLQFGGSITINSADWTGPTSGSWNDLPSTLTETLASNATVAAGATDVYTVTTNETVEQAAWDRGTTTCPSQSPGNGGFLNSATVTHNGVDQTATACAQPSKPTIAKHFVSAVQNQGDPSQWAVSYTVTVDNSKGAEANYYTLSDTPGFAHGVDIDSVTVNGSPASYSGGKVVLAGDPTAIAAGATTVYTVVFSVEVGDVASGAQQCGDGPGDGFFNAATLSVGPADWSAQDCGNITPQVNPSVAKAVKSTTQNSDGTWSITYDVTVTQPATGPTNPAGLSGKYNLSDTLDFGGDIDVNSASWEYSGTSHNWSVGFGDAQTLATGKAIKQGVTDTYTVVVNADVTQKAVDEGNTVCKDSQSPQAGGFLNTALLTAGSNSTQVQACSEPAVPTVDKTLNSSTRNSDGTWTLSYQLSVTNPSGTAAAQFTLKDNPAALPTGVSADGDWHAAAVGGAPDPDTSSWADGTEATIAHGSLAAGATYSYTVTVKVTVTAAAVGDQGKCGDNTGIVVTNNGSVTSGNVTSDSSACGMVQYYDVGIVKAHKPIDGSAVDSGKNDPIDYTLTVTNHGSTGATNVVVSDPMPAGLTVKPGSIVAPDWDVSASTDSQITATYTANGGVLPVGATSEIDLTAIVGELSRPNIDSQFPDIENTACVSTTIDDNPANNCSTDTTKVKSVAVQAQAVCRNDAPLVSYTVTPINVAVDPTIALIWWTPDAYANRDQSIPANDKSAILANGASQVDYIPVPSGWQNGDPISGSQLWPGAAVGPDGHATAWPGWRQQPNRQWVLDPTAPFYNLRGQAIVEIRINPSTAATEVYPPATPNCNPNPPTGTNAGPALPDTGSNVIPLVGLGAVLLLLGVAAVAWMIRRRRADGSVG
jgi:uncharacterized repeat protein (TIGR01451 family)/LPXTG-motif cell wall-anchored protein